MRILLLIILAILVFLAASSGMTKIMLMQQDVEFFENYGFTNTTLQAFGLAQVVGGLMLILSKTRLLGAAIVAITFLISGVMLIMAGNIAFTVFTVIALALLAFVIWQSVKNNST